MNKYELTVVVNAKIEDDVRVATVEKVKEYVAPPSPVLLRAPSLLLMLTNGVKRD